jgi:hypothetical protein
MSLLPQLPLLARKGWRGGDPAPESLYRLDAGLPDLAYRDLALHAGGRDPLAASLPVLLDSPWDPAERDVHALAEADLAELAALADACAELPIPQLGVDAAPGVYDLADRYTALLTRISCLQVWRHCDDPFLADPAWLRAVLHRSTTAALRPAESLPGPVEDALLRELLDRPLHPTQESSR